MTGLVVHVGAISLEVINQGYSILSGWVKMPPTGKTMMRTHSGWGNAHYQSAQKAHRLSITRECTAANS
ncbi:hypothetical protein CWC12_09120 [Pseudoalteromonas ruthenica]|uniref:Uncharacterized protein n=1 Tax=Pseudoalteromonas ruthenica TaxID=151081 RepID=A0A0F4PUQ9_9GAMM|nr:hypothetical protein TW76_05650 [Pseudoalteromonas ruthenica]KJY99805.1 hypothetical protein TW72_09245 [Pseudoalteromonas ruthenica]TMO88327.1 hypothetical protein CWC12_09120 [Pseudoalteromonas ruthenica]TMO92991.1 hypothetical protein CWC13_07610 [Pseudoalteromonas ruthenica]TMP00519.1 hypothetical protein CWC07_04745 [Pseudoalteromonas ruthenica]